VICAEVACAGDQEEGQGEDRRALRIRAAEGAAEEEQARGRQGEGEREKQEEGGGEAEGEGGDFEQREVESVGIKMIKGADKRVGSVKGWVLPAEKKREAVGLVALEAAITTEREISTQEGESDEGITRGWENLG
jgi:hypothetical protein